MRHRLWLALLASLAAGSAAAADRPGDPAAGGTLARALCSSCHLTSPGQRGPVPDGVPTFMAIAARTDITADRLVEAMVSPTHPVMPQAPLSRQQMLDVAAYVLSLRQP